MPKSSTNPAPTVKAFAVTEHCENTGGIIFAAHNIVARRLGANEHADGDISYVTCKRAPWADCFADTGRVPAGVMVDNGWHFECSGCGRTIDSDIFWERDMLPSDIIGDDGTSVYCDAVCEAREALRRAKSKKLETRWLRRFRKFIRRRFPDAVCGDGHAYAGMDGDRLVIIQVHMPFTFPGMKIAPAELAYDRRASRMRGESDKPTKPHWSVCFGDKVAFEAYARGETAPDAGQVAA